MEFLEEGIRPWGRYYKLFQNNKIWIKSIEVNPQSRLSLQKHQFRSEKWIVVEGQGEAVVDGRSVPLKAGDQVEVPLGAVHRMCNPGHEKLVFVEVAFGLSLTEEDIIRLEDDYNRVEGVEKEQEILIQTS